MRKSGSKCLQGVWAFLGLLCGFVAVSGCQLARSKSSAYVAADILVLRGSAVDKNGLGIPFAELFVGSNSNPSGVAGDDGAFEVTLDSRALSDWQSNGAPFVRVESPTGSTPEIKYVGPLELSARGSRDLGNVVLKKPGVLRGVVSQYAQTNRGSKALGGALVQFAHHSMTSAADGRFEIRDAPAGKYHLRVTASGFSDFSQEVSVDEDKDSDLKSGIVLYPPGVIDGSLTMSSSYSQGDLIAAGTPYRRTFQLSFGSDVKFIRLDPERSSVVPDGSGNAKAPWMPVQSTMEIDFGSNGDKTLYFQFSNQDHSVTSLVRSLVVPLDLFSASSGFVIGDGSGVVRSRYVTLKVDVPPIARMMRVAGSESTLSQAEWRPVQPLFDYPILPLGDSLTTGSSFGGSVTQPSTAGQRTVYLQFSDGINKGDGQTASLSSVYQASAQIDLFPSMGTNSFLINGGAAVAAERFVRLDIQVPANAWQMRFFESSGGSSSIANGTDGNGAQTGSDWVEAQPIFYYFFATPGQKFLNLQFRDRGAFNSPIFQKTIRISPFEGAADAFLINNGAPYSIYQDLLLTLNPPATAHAFRVSESASNFSSNQLPFIALAPVFPFLADGNGLRTIYLQYQDRDGTTSQVFAQSIYISHFPDNVGDFHINGGASVSLAPLLLLDIVVPPAAQQMAIATKPFLPPGSRDLSFEYAVPQWQRVGNAAAVLVSGRGLKTVYLKFRTGGNSQEESATIVRHIIYDPFPPGSVDFESNGGIAESLLPATTLSITAPPSAYRMRITRTNDHGVLYENDVLYSNQFTFNLPEVSGDYRICIRVYNSDDDASEAVCHIHRLNLWPASYLRLSLNGESPANLAPSTSNPLLTLGFTPPPAAVVTRFRQVELSESCDNLQGDAWISLPTGGGSPLTLQLTGTPGQKRVCAQFGMEFIASGSVPKAVSPIFFKDIELTP